MINGVVYGLVFPGQFTLNAVNVVMYSNNDLCMMNPCYYGGTCRVIENEAKCQCLSGFLGSRCEIRANVPYFQGGEMGSNSYIRLEPMILRRDEFAAVFEILPELDTGLIMYSESKGDFISLAMRAGKLEFRFNLGQGSVTISTDFTLKLNEWHHVEIIRVGLEGILIVDYVSVQRGVAPGKWLNLDLQDTAVYLGGGVSSNQAGILRRTGVQIGFTGCIRELETENEDLRERPLDIMISDRDDSNGKREFHKVMKCGCKDFGCQNEGTCRRRPHDFRCECRNGYTGYKCHIQGCAGKDVVFDVGFAIDGSNSIDSNEYRLTKDFVVDVIGIFNVSMEGTRISLLEYANEASFIVYFDDNDDVLHKVRNLQQSHGTSTNIGTGLQRALEMFKDYNGMRKEAEKLFIFFTDGFNSDPEEDLTPYARQLKDAGVRRTIAVGVGSSPKTSELINIAGSKNNVIQLGEFEELKLIVESLIPDQCKGDD
ncbi:pikachurin-like [Montipora capricornis]|uniref:pikachurin-like n=1 Tax=Montipora capricornis TaxID=246305 RepID=UPI0035F18E10